MQTISMCVQILAKHSSLVYPQNRLTLVVLRSTKFLHERDATALYRKVDVNEPYFIKYFCSARFMSKFSPRTDKVFQNMKREEMETFHVLLIVIAFTKIFSTGSFAISDCEKKKKKLFKFNVKSFLEQTCH